MTVAPGLPFSNERRTMTRSDQPSAEEAFDALLMRRQLVDLDGNAVDGDGPDPQQWALADALFDANVPPNLVPLGSGRMTVITLDEREFVRQKLVHEPEPDSQYLRVMLEMDEAAQRAPAMSDLVAVMLPGGVTVVHEVVVAWADLELQPKQSLDPDADVLVWVSLPHGHAILRRGPDLPVVATGAQEQQPSDIGHGGSDVQQ